VEQWLLELPTSSVVSMLKFVIWAALAAFAFVAAITALKFYTPRHRRCAARSIADEFPLACAVLPQNAQQRWVSATFRNALHCGLQLTSAH
jgi:hypothetical protein